MTKKEIKEFTDIVMGAELVEAKHEFPFRKGKLTYHFCYKDENREFKFSAETESEDEARKNCLNAILAKARAFEPKKNWPKRILDAPGLSSQRYLMIRRMVEIAEELKKKIKLNQGSMRVYFVVTEKTEYVHFDNIISAIDFAIKIGKKAKDVEYVTV